MIFTQVFAFPSDFGGMRSVLGTVYSHFSPPLLSLYSMCSALKCSMTGIRVGWDIIGFVCMRV